MNDPANGAVKAAPRSIHSMGVPSHRMVQIVMLAHGRQIDGAAIGLTIEGAEQFARQLAAAIADAKAVSKSGLILPPGIGQPFQP